MCGDLVHNLFEKTHITYYYDHYKINCQYLIIFSFTYGDSKFYGDSEFYGDLEFYGD